MNQNKNKQIDIKKPTANIRSRFSHKGNKKIIYYTPSTTRLKIRNVMAATTVPMILLIIVLRSSVFIIYTPFTVSLIKTNIR